MATAPPPDTLQKLTNDLKSKYVPPPPPFSGDANTPQSAKLPLLTD